MAAIKRWPLALFPLAKEQGEDIVYSRRNAGQSAMSARRILGLEQVPRVGLFAH